MENNFKRLNQEAISRFESKETFNVKQKIQSNLNFIQLMGNLVELFLPNQIESMGKLISKGSKLDSIDKSNKINKFPNQ